MAVNLSPIWGAGAQLLDNSGNVLSGGKIYTYAAGTTTSAATYTSSNGITANSNPIILNSAGRVPYEIWLTDGVSYKFVLKDSNDTLIATYDNLTGINSNFIAYTSQQEIQTATAGQTVFTLTTMQYQPNTNNLSVFVDGVNQYGPSAQYAYVETDATTVTFVSGLHVGASVKFTTASPVSSSSTNAENVAYDPPFTGAVATNVEAKLAQTVSVKDFGAVGDGVADDTAAIQAAIDYTATTGQSVFIPSGTYISGSLTLRTGTKIVGESSQNTIIKARNGLNADFVVCEDSTTNGIWLESLTFHGNSANNTSGDTLKIRGMRPTLRDLLVFYSAGTAVTTSVDFSGGIPDGSFEGYFSQIYIDRAQGSGWIHNGPSDSMFDSIVILDCGLKQTLTYYGIQFNSTGRCQNIHAWNKDNVAAITIAGCYVNVAGMTFANCHFESGRYSLLVDSSNNTFQSCSYYAPGGEYCIYLNGYQNVVTGVLGPGYRTFNQDYAGIWLVGQFNIIDVTAAGAVSPITHGLTQGAVVFDSNGKYNVVTVRGYNDTGLAYYGTPDPTNTVNLVINGAAGASYSSEFPFQRTAYTPTIAAETGTITTATSTGEYQIVGTTCFFTAQVTITTNGTGAGSVYLGLPKTSGIPINQSVSGIITNAGGAALGAVISAASGFVQLRKYDGTYPGADGLTLCVSGSYEVA